MLGKTTIPEYTCAGKLDKAESQESMQKNALRRGHTIWYIMPAAAAAVTKAKALAAELPALSWLEVPRDFPEKGPFFADRASHRIKGGRSQGKQDVIARAIFRSIGAQNRRFVEIGFNENEQCVGSGSNTCQLWLDGWTGLLLDAAHSNASIGLHTETLDSRNVASVLRKHSVPTQVDFLSIDVDSVDIWLLEAILQGGFKPRMIAIEYNSNFPWANALAFPDASRFGVARHEDRVQHGSHGIYLGNCYYGSSPRALDLVGRRFGYATVALVSPLDLIMVPRELERRARRGLYMAQDDTGSVGRFAMDQWRNSLFLNESVGLNTWKGRTMTRAQADELIDWSVWRAHTERGASAEAAATAARRRAKAQILELARSGHECFRALCPSGEKCPRQYQTRAQKVPDEIRPPQQWVHLRDWKAKVAPNKGGFGWIDWMAMHSSNRSRSRREWKAIL